MRWFVPLDAKTGLRVPDCICSEDKRFQIAKALVHGVEDFMLWDRQKIVDHWPTAQEAKDAAKKILESESCQA